MPTIKHITNPRELAALRPGNGVSILTSIEWTLLPPDLHLVLEADGEVQARCSIWQSTLPEHNRKQPVAVGHFEASSVETGVLILRATCDWINKLGRRYVIGPINGTTWHKYRLVTENGTRTPFFLEPQNPEYFMAAWSIAGFTTLAEFHSGIMPPQVAPDPRLDRVRCRLNAAGVSIRNLDIKE